MSSQDLIEAISKISTQPVRLMEVCGGHTWAVQQHGLSSLLPDSIQLISGPGCPVCVTHRSFIDQAIDLAVRQNISILTFGDMLKVPGTHETLEDARSKGGKVITLLSPMDAISLALDQPDTQFVFLGIGFETTAPGVAATLIQAKELQIKNFFVLSAHKIMPPAMRALVNDQLMLDGFICPGHVSAITGSDAFQFLAEDHHIPCAVSGFGSEDILLAILLLIKQINQGQPRVDNAYPRVVTPQGNGKALSVMNQVFEPVDDWWRGLGKIPKSGLGIRASYAQYDARCNLELLETETLEPAECRCGDILRGIIKPTECALFGTACTPEEPVGACMVSSEGTCQAYYRYHQNPVTS